MQAERSQTPEGANSINSGSYTPTTGGGLGALNLVPACIGPDCSHNYALLLSGGFNATQNHIRYWNDISFMYQTLNKTYGYQRGKIFVLMSDGISSGIAPAQCDCPGWLCQDR